MSKTNICFEYISEESLDSKTAAFQTIDQKTYKNNNLQIQDTPYISFFELRIFDFVRFPVDVFLLSSTSEFELW